MERCTATVAYPDFMLPLLKIATIARYALSDDGWGISLYSKIAVSL